MKTNYLTTILVLITISLFPAQSYAKKPAGVVVLDANNKQVGVLLSGGSTTASVIVKKDGNTGLLGVRKDGYAQNDFAYLQPGCQGTPIMEVNRSSMITQVHVRGDQGYTPSGIRPADTDLIYSYWFDGECFPVDPPIAVGDFPDEDGETAVLYDLSTFTPPFRYATSP